MGASKHVTGKTTVSFSCGTFVRFVQYAALNIQCTAIVYIKKKITEKYLQKGIFNIATTHYKYLVTM